MLLYKLLTVFFFILSVTAAMATKLRVMPMGDSITVGLGFNGGYRKPLFLNLQENGYDIEFVGNSTENVSSSMGLNMDRHEGHKRWGINNFLEFSREILDMADDPDVILLMIGNEDMRDRNLFPDAIDRLDHLITHIADMRPHSLLIVSSVLPVQSNSTQKWISRINKRIEDFNTRIPSMVERQQKAGIKISFVDLAENIGDGELQNFIHPTKIGYKLIGSLWATAIMQNIGPNGDSYSPQVLRVQGSMDRSSVMLTFSKPMNDVTADKTKFSISNGINVLDATMDPDKRQIILSLDQKLSHDTNYRVSIKDGVVDRTENMLKVEPDTKVSFHAGWRFIVLTDWHSAEKYVFGGHNIFSQRDIEQDIKVIDYLSKTYGGEFVMIAGDTNSGAWTRESFQKRLSNDVGRQMTPSEIVLEAGRRCYGGMLHSFRLGGYAKVLLAHGDHEAGDNPWKAGDIKSILQPEYRKTLGDQLNMDYNQKSRYDGMIGNVPARPMNSTFTDTTYAYIHKNALVVTVDPFYQESPFIDIAPSGTVAVRITGEQLEWLDAVLSEARQLPEVKHIFVQAHTPVLHPVRKTRSSGQMLDQEERSDFWNILRKHSVDVYFSGEVHLNTVTKDTESNVVQVVSRGNYFNNFLTVDMSDDVIDIRCFDEVGTERIKYNMNYSESGRLVIVKNGNTTTITGNGQLALLNQSASLLHFSFEEKLPLEERSILGLGLAPGSGTYTPKMKSVPVREIDCSEVIPNVGEFGFDYDAISANVNLVQGISGKAGLFQNNSRAAVWSMGPHFEGREVSYSLWFKTQATDSPILISHEGFWIKSTVMNFRLRNGRPELIVGSTQRLRPKQYHTTRLNDDKWHHVVITNPADDILLSQIQMYIDGEEIATQVDGKDEILAFANGGVISLGGFGYGRTSSGDITRRDNRVGYLNGDNYVGLMDEVKIFARALSKDEVVSLYQNHASNIS
mmetsp:Transcript_9756/g.18332  ORF Transcript_9756/g.18332 Transcript_9756/m.18332 type:complete len:962 (-) Transcript_9756:1208-4093(-)